jgi:hypothetical protein
MIEVLALSGSRTFHEANGWAQDRGWLRLAHLDEQRQFQMWVALFPPGRWHGLVTGGVAEAPSVQIGFQVNQPAHAEPCEGHGTIEVDIPSGWRPFSEANGWAQHEGWLRLAQLDEQRHFQRWIALFPPDGWHGLVTGGMAEEPLLQIACRVNEMASSSG